MHQYSEIKSKHKSKIAEKAYGSKSRSYFEVKTYAKQSEAKKKLKFKK